MMLWKLACAVLAVGVALATLPGEVSAQQAGARPQLAGASARPAPVRARDLMTPQERQAYRAAMRAARNNAARQDQIRTRMRETLQQRAAAKGAVLAEPAFARPTVKGKEAANPERHPAPPPRAP